MCDKRRKCNRSRRRYRVPYAQICIVLTLLTIQRIMKNIIGDTVQKLTIFSVCLLYCIFISLPIQFDYLLVGNNRLLFCTFTHVASSLSSLKALHIVSSLELANATTVDKDKSCAITITKATNFENLNFEDFIAFTYLFNYLFMFFKNLEYNFYCIIVKYLIVKLNITRR